MKNIKEIRAIVFKDGDVWVAQCLEFDIGAQAPDVDTLQKRLNAVLAAEFSASMESHGEPFAGIEPAPEFFQNLWDTQSAKLTPLKPTNIATNGSVHLDLGLCA